MLARGLLLDGPATAILAQRGFEAWLGVGDVRFVTQWDVLYAMEETLDPRFSLRPGAQVSVNDRPCSKRLLQGQVASGAQVVSVLRDPKQRQVGHGVVIYENQLGGRVAVCPWDVNTSEASGGQRNVQRAAQINGLLRYLGRGRPLGAVSGAPWLVCQFLADDIRWRGVVWNASPDAVETIQVTLPEGMRGVAGAVQLDAQEQRIQANWEDGTLHLQRPLYQWECVILCDSDEI